MHVCIYMCMLLQPLFAVYMCLTDSVLAPVYNVYMSVSWCPDPVFSVCVTDGALAPVYSVCLCLGVLTPVFFVSVS